MFMIITGCILSLIGAIGSVFNITEYHKYSSITDRELMENYLNRPSYAWGPIKDRAYYNELAGDAMMWMVIFAIVFIIGVVLIIVGGVRRSNGSTVNKMPKGKGFNTRMCLRCRNICDANSPFCTKCGNDMRLQAQKKSVT